jgi:hypothetical protein
MYVAAECFRYKVTGARDALEHARQGMQAIVRLEAITGIPGFPARSFIKVGVDAQPREGEWHDTPDKAWRWKGDTSSDEIVGHISSPHLHDLAAGESELPGGHRPIEPHPRQQLQLIDVDGQPTRWGWWDRRHGRIRTKRVCARCTSSSPARRDNMTATNCAHGSRRRMTISHDSQFPAHPQPVMVPGRSTTRTTSWRSVLLSAARTRRIALLAVYKQSLERSWQIERRAQSALNFLRGRPAKEFDRESLRTLQEIPMDQIRDGHELTPP